MDIAAFAHQETLIDHCIVRNDCSLADEISHFAHHLTRGRRGIDHRLRDADIAALWMQADDPVLGFRPVGAGSEKSRAPWGQRLHPLAIAEAGERVIGDYTFNHAPFAG
jgi:hypothetical protein